MEMAEAIERGDILEEQASWAAQQTQEAARWRWEAERSQLFAELRQLQQDVNDLSEQLEEGQQRESELEASLDERRAALEIHDARQALTQEAWRVWEAEMGGRLEVVAEEQAALRGLWEWRAAGQAAMAGQPDIAGPVEEAERAQRAAMEASETHAMLGMVAEMHARAVGRMEGERGWDWEAEAEAELPEAQAPLSNMLQRQLEEAQAGNVALQQRVGRMEMELAAMAQRQGLQEAEQAGRLGLLAGMQAGTVQRLAAMGRAAQGQVLVAEGDQALHAGAALAWLMFRSFQQII